MNSKFFKILLIALITLFSARKVESYLPFRLFGFPFPFNPFDIFKLFPSTSHDWHRGPNVCIDQRIEPVDSYLNLEVIPLLDSDNESETCRGDKTKYFCISMITRRGRVFHKINFYHCCPGFVRPANGGNGCVLDYVYT
ncbi:hypothetical protein NPIL_326771 [Nephila pilipes]|uniref:Uncharacterized protein n=1 Tax=Nephila pilipes TaxID=299642 RepID=A0A8X6TP90_NEPPI|nr:hypothetical protein NPIL_326771 [Nephila pilipes]